MLNREYDSKSLEFNDLKIFDIGEEACTQKEFYGPAIKPYYCIHFVMSGKGKLIFRKRSYNLEEFNMFLTYPEEITFFEADEENPWHLIKIGFGGALVKDILNSFQNSDEEIIFNLKDKQEEITFILERLLDERENKIKSIGYFNLLFSEIIQIKGTKQNLENKNFYISKTKELILNTYWEDLRVEKIANDLNIDRSYLSRIFKSEIGESPQNFLIRTRMERAKELLSREDISIADCGRSIGYDDQLAFSKIFKKYFGMSPSSFRKL